MDDLCTAKPLILISQRVDHLEKRSETRDSLDQALSHWVIASKALPLALPNVLPPEMLMDFLAQLKPTGIILSGGNNIGDCCERDQTESILLDWAELHHIPVLGICRGMQFIGKRSGAGLTSVMQHVAIRHEISGQLNAVVNSYHDYVLDTVPDGFSALAYSHDGHLEAIQSNTQWPCEAWMWHPERDSSFEPIWLARFRSLMKLK